MGDAIVSEPAAEPTGIYRYDDVDRAFVHERVEQFRQQIGRRLTGELSEDEFKPIRLMNGLYLQLHAYMLRVAVPYGVLSSAKLRGLGHIARAYDRGYGHFTTRQNMQFHWIKLDQAADALKDLADVELHAIQTSGNCIRNVSTDQFAGAAADEVVDPRIYAEILRQWSSLHPEFSFLPRKFKIAVTGSPDDRTALQVYDIGVAAKRNEAGEVGFSIYVGGGLGRTPILGVKVRDWLPEAEFLAYMEAILRVYNAYGRRDNSWKARIKILVQALGKEKFTEAVEAEYAVMPKEKFRLDPRIVSGIRAHFTEPKFETLPAMSGAFERAQLENREFAQWVRTSLNLHRVPGYASVIVSLKPIGLTPGDISADQMDGLADLADQYSFGEIRIAHEQNLVLPHVRRDDLYALWQQLSALDLATPNTGLITDIIACPGLDYCSLANARSIPIATRIAERFRNLERQHDIGELHLNISGCINACGHHHVGHIGILGVDKHGKEFYQITLGGAADNDAALGAITGPAFSYDDVVDAVETIIETYVTHRQDGERFIDTYRRIGMKPFKETLYAAA